MQKDSDQHKHTILYEHLYLWVYILILQGILLGQKSVQAGTEYTSYKMLAAVCHSKQK